MHGARLESRGRCSQPDPRGGHAQTENVRPGRCGTRAAGRLLPRGPGRCRGRRRRRLVGRQDEGGGRRASLVDPAGEWGSSRAPVASCSGTRRDGEGGRAPWVLCPGGAQGGRGRRGLWRDHGLVARRVRAGGGLALEQGGAFRARPSPCGGLLEEVPPSQGRRCDRVCAHRWPSHGRTRPAESSRGFGTLFAAGIRAGGPAISLPETGRGPHDAALARRPRCVIIHDRHTIIARATLHTTCSPTASGRCRNWSGAVASSLISPDQPRPRPAPQVVLQAAMRAVITEPGGGEKRSGTTR